MGPVLFLTVVDEPLQHDHGHFVHGELNSKNECPLLPGGLSSCGPSCPKGRNNRTVHTLIMWLDAEADRICKHCDCSWAGRVP